MQEDRERPLSNQTDDDPQLSSHHGFQSNLYDVRDFSAVPLRLRRAVADIEVCEIHEIMQILIETYSNVVLSRLTGDEFVLVFEEAVVSKISK